MGMMTIITGYAPHNLKPLPERRHFYTMLDSTCRSCNSNVGILIIGDFNARVGKAQPGENAILGDFGWGRRAQHEIEQPNRELMIEFCTSVGIQIANTFYQQTLQDKVTFMEAGALPMGEISKYKYHILDLVLCEAA
eukprot:268923-Pyramimonas_sp.AAC.1